MYNDANVIQIMQSLAIQINFRAFGRGKYKHRKSCKFQRRECSTIILIKEIQLCQKIPKLM